VILCSLTVLLLAFGPGAVLTAIATPAHSRATRIALAASPSVTYGLLGGAVGWAAVFGRTWPPLGILGFEVAVVVVAAVARTVFLRSARSPVWKIRSVGLANRLHAHRNDIAALGACLVATSIVTWLMLGGLESPPGWDSMNHAFLAHRVLQVGSALPRDICVTGDVAPAPACAFYPMAPHVLWAQVAQLTGAPLSTVMLAATMVVTPVTAAVGTFGIVRVCGGGSALSGAAAFLPAVIGPIWPSLVTGRLTVLLGAALAPSAALLYWLAMRTRRSPAVLALAAAGLGGVVLAHSYDTVAAALLGLGLLVARPPQHRWWILLLRTAAMGLGAVLLVAPQAPGLLGARGERVLYPALRSGDFWGSLGHWVFAPGQYLATLIAPAQPGAELVLAPLAGTGALVSWLITLGWIAGIFASVHPRLRWGRPFALAHLLTIAVVVIIDVGSGAIRDALAGLFYGDPRRPLWSSLVAPGVLCLAGWLSALGLTREGLARLFRIGRRLAGSLSLTQPWLRRPRRLALPQLAPVLVAAALTGAIAAVPETWQAHERFAARAMPADPAYRRVGAWLRAQGGGVVADDLHREFVTWVAVDEHLPLLKGLVPLDVLTNPDWADRIRVWNALAWTKPGRGSCLPDRFDVRWVVVAAPHMPGGRRTYRPERLAISPYVHLAHLDPPLWVYAVDHLCGTSP
jgi:hypothetical protein